MNATMTCISAAQSLLDTFLQISIPGLQKAPSIIYVRTVYALITLLKADYAVSTDPAGMGAVIDSKSLKLDAYLENVTSRIGKAVGEPKCRIPSHWAFVIKEKLKTWHDEHMQWRKDGGPLKRARRKQVNHDCVASSSLCVLIGS
jgi:hypothetical protein